MIPYKFQGKYKVIKRTVKKPRKKPVQREKAELLLLCLWIKKTYPDLIYRVDFGADVPLGFKNKNLQKQMQMKDFKYPDLFIANKKSHSGLFIEFKATGFVLYKQDGSLRKSDHLAGQLRSLQLLRLQGFKAEFVIGLENAKEFIAWYLTNKQGAK